MQAETPDIQEAAKRDAPRDIMSYPVVQSVVSRANRFLPYLQGRLARQQKEDSVRCWKKKSGSLCVTWTSPGPFLISCCCFLFSISLQEYIETLTQRYLQLKSEWKKSLRERHLEMAAVREEYVFLLRRAASFL